MGVTRKRPWSFGGPILETLANEEFNEKDQAIEFLREIRSIPERGALVRTAGDREHRFSRAINRYSDNVAALVGSGAGLFIDPILARRQQFSPARMRSVRQKARDIVASLIAISATAQPVLRPFAKDTSELEARYPPLAVLGRRLEHAFVPPLWLSISRRDAGLGILTPDMLPGRGEWHAVIRSMDDLLTWATADVFRTDTAENFGQCQHCDRLYFAKRAKGHRFCPTTDCRDQFWRARDGLSRVRRSRARARSKK